MGRVSVAQVVNYLNNGGVRAEAAYPAGQITRVITPVAAVSLAQARPGNGSYTMLVEVLGPKESGGLTCQQKALEVCTILENAGAVCKQSGCEFLSKGNVFRVKVEAEFSTAEKYSVVLAGRTLPYACGFSAQQKASAASGNLDGVMWEITLEEFFPWGVLDTLGAEEPFQLDIRCAGNIERYEGCVWLERKREAEQNGIRQIRKGKAMSLVFTA
jgi:hypothetical protein